MTHAPLQWRRTVIGDDKLRHDFCAYVENITVARIFRTKLSESESGWSVNMQVGYPPFNGMSLTREDAILTVENEFARFLETDAGKEDPQLWPHDQRSVQLRQLLHSDPVYYADLLEGLRSGRIQRVGWKK